jgi:alpha-1,4-digalacturonate transport system substrate-binding protein
MIEAARTVQQANGMEDAIAIDKSGHRVSTMLSQYGTGFFDDEGKVALDQAKAEQALGQLNDLLQSDDISKDFWLEAGSRYEGANEIFLAGQVPIYISGNWQVGLLAQSATFDWASVPNPCEENCGGFPGGKYMVAFSESDEPELAAYFVDWMNQPEHQEALDQGASWLPTRNELIESGIEYPQRSEDMAVYLADVPETPDSAYASFTHPSFTAAADLLIKEFDKTVAGQQDVATTVTNLRAELEKLAG